MTGLAAKVLLIGLGFVSLPDAVEAGAHMGQECDKTSSSPLTIGLKWNAFSSEWGAYEVTGCTGVNPKLKLTAGTTYTFDQSDVSNWYHPVGFAYIAGGAHQQCTKKIVGGAPVVGECPELGGESPSSTLQYWVDGVAVTNDESGFGLDAYEPLFFNSEDWWKEYGKAPKKPFYVTLKIPSDATYTRIYYFCHIHHGMSAEIEVVGSSASSKTVISAAHLGKMTQESAQAIYTKIVSSEQPQLSAFDKKCGTHISTGFQPGAKHSTCVGSTWLCGETSGDFAECLQAVDCQMHHAMAVSIPSTSTSKFATFARQMIPHHQNAVAMAKVLKKFHKASHAVNSGPDYPKAGTEDQDSAWADGLIRSLINAQNHQIQQMQDWLEANQKTGLAGTSTMCYTKRRRLRSEEKETANLTAFMQEMSPPARQLGAHMGKKCDKTASSPTTIKLKWNAYVSEWGAYEVEGCTGINPKLTLTAGTVYTFDQSDISNWYHPVGFSYIAGGAHEECTASDGKVGECPELGGESPKSTLQYYVKDVAVTNDESGFGLDAYEPLFFNSQDWWTEESKTKPFKVTLTIPADASYTRIYYFCHIHHGMSAEIQVAGSTASSTVINAASLGKMTQASAQAIYTKIASKEQAALSNYDKNCGTHASEKWYLHYGSANPTHEHSTCKGRQFLCGAGASSGFAKCLQAVDCQMHHDMAISIPSASKSKFATFARQMIPHHQNAVAMAKVLKKAHRKSDYPADGTEDQDMAWAEALIRSIINVQNHQIQQMQSWLDANGPLAGTSSNCYTTTTTTTTVTTVTKAGPSPGPVPSPSATTGQTGASVTSGGVASVAGIAGVLSMFLL